jgi:hypothetical protein
MEKDRATTTITAAAATTATTTVGTKEQISTNLSPVQLTLQRPHFTSSRQQQLQQHRMIILVTNQNLLHNISSLGKEACGLVAVIEDPTQLELHHHHQQQQHQ